MKRETLFLRIVIYILGLMGLGLCIVWFPAFAIRTFKTNLNLFCIASIWIITVIPFWNALYQALKILRYIDTEQAFSMLSVNALKNIKSSAWVISGLYVIGLPFLYVYADREDAPGIILIAVFFLLVAFVVGVFAAVLQKVFQNAVEIKMENDLTV